MKRNARIVVFSIYPPEVDLDCQARAAEEYQSRPMKLSRAATTILDPDTSLLPLAAAVEEAEATDVNTDAVVVSPVFPGWLIVVLVVIEVF